ncbi:LysR family transcriptional regulator [Frateuria aurantia]
MGIQPAELSFLVTLAQSTSLSAAARELSITPAAVSKRLALIETRLGMSLLTRTARRMQLTPEGRVIFERAQKILRELSELNQMIDLSRNAPSGLLRVQATLGFGRMVVAPAISSFVQRYRDVDIRLTLSESAPSLADDRFDLSIQFGPPPDSRVLARRLAGHERILCASPSYLARKNEPEHPVELQHHACIDLRQGSEPGGVWRLQHKEGGRDAQQAVRIKPSLVTNDGESAVDWALAGHGIVMRAQWDVARYIRSGRLVRVLPEWQTPHADIYAVYLPQHHDLPRVRLFLEHLSEHIAAHRPEMNWR